MDWTRTRDLRWACAATGLLAAGLAATLWIRPSHALWPQAPDWTYFSFADEAVGGKSRVLTLREDRGVLKADLVFDSNLNTRFAGIGFSPTDKGIRSVTGSRYVRLRYRTRTTAPLRVQVRLDIPGLTRPGITLTERCLLADLPPSPDWRTIEIPLSEFRTPGWWYQANHLVPTYPDPGDLRRFLGINILDSELSPGGQIQQLEIEHLSLEGSWAWVLGLAASLPLPALVLLVWRRIRKSSAQTPPQAKDPEPQRPFGQPQAVTPQEEQDFQRITQLIATRYPESELCLATINRETGIPEAKISAVLEKRTLLRFKPYLNQVRIDEAARLLTQTDLSITEIAYRVGYANTTHFNRVFKSLKQASPSEFRRTSSPTKVSAAQMSEDNGEM